MFVGDRARHLGVMREGGTADVVDVAAARVLLGWQPMPNDILAVIDAGEEGSERLRVLASSSDLPAACMRNLSDLTLLAPFDPPRGNVLAIGRNYQKHAEEGARALNTTVGPPTIFTKAISTITGPHSDIPIDASVSVKIDWEVELGVVMGCRGANIERENALDYVFGYTVLNDVTARDIQREWGGQWFKGKSLDGSCPMGPWVITKDEVPDVQALQLQLRVNGQLKQDGNTRDMIYPVDAIIEWLSIGMTLLPGMVIASGTPEGVGYTRTPPEFLQPGDVMETEIEGIGVLRNRFVASPS